MSFVYNRSGEKSATMSDKEDYHFLFSKTVLLPQCTPPNCRNNSQFGDNYGFFRIVTVTIPLGRGKEQFELITRNTFAVNIGELSGRTGRHVQISVRKRGIFFFLSRITGKRIDRRKKFDFVLSIDWQSILLVLGKMCCESRTDCNCSPKLLIFPQWLNSLEIINAVVLPI